jgi:hypothetical protein
VNPTYRLDHLLHTGIRHIWYVTYVAFSPRPQRGGNRTKSEYHGTHSASRLPIRTPRTHALLPRRPKSTSQKMSPHSPVPNHKVDPRDKLETIPTLRNSLDGFGTVDPRRLAPRHSVIVPDVKSEFEGVPQRKCKPQDTGMESHWQPRREQQ